MMQLAEDVLQGLFWGKAIDPVLCRFSAEIKLASHLPSLLNLTVFDTWSIPFSVLEISLTSNLEHRYRYDTWLRLSGSGVLLQKFGLGLR